MFLPRDVTNLGASITIPPEPIQINKDFIPADTADTLSEVYII